ncbi:MAG: YkgJ family cysteine cluster protein [Desulfobacterium sp.]|jgi:Fe-S-cluster containining protein|nr:YkgJ family cysteine cluster protein [Desulfobacterium sp.]
MAVHLQDRQIMQIQEKIPGLNKIYSAFAETTREFKKDAACTKGCGFCCKEAGSIDITTLEGLVIRKAMEGFSRSRQKNLTKIFQQEIKKREKGLTVPCPFLMKNNVCMIYQVRPFSCRRIYSVHVCTQNDHPTMNRYVMEAADQSIKELQQLDNTGYSGHLSYILYMLSVPAFMDLYKTGEFKPEEIMAFGKTHKIAINKMMVNVN